MILYSDHRIVTLLTLSWKKNQNDILKKNLENNLDIKTFPTFRLSHLFPTYSSNLSPTYGSFK